MYKFAYFKSKYYICKNLIDMSSLITNVLGILIVVISLVYFIAFIVALNREAKKPFFPIFYFDLSDDEDQDTN